VESEQTIRKNQKTRPTQRTGKMKNSKIVKLIGIGLLAIGLFGNAFAEKRDSDLNADHNLKSNARVNPTTLAMEFSIPFGSYAGRNGNSMPLAINYSSKVWTMKSHDFRTRYDSGTGLPTNPYFYTT
jgi:hypothetical protein